MTPEIIVLDAVDELNLLDATLGGCGYKEEYTDRILRDVYELLHRRYESPMRLNDYLEKIRREEQQYGELLMPRIRNLHEAAHTQLLDKQIYRWDNILPFRYERRMGTKTLFLALKGINKSLITYHLSGLPT